MKISVKTLDSQTKNFTVSDTFKVKEFKEYIASEVNIPADKQRLIFRGKVLQDDKLLSEYGANGCVIHLVERKPQTGGGSSQDGPGSSSSSSTGHSHDGSLGPNIVMGAFSMPVDVVGATQQIVQSLVNQLGVDSAQANISTSSSDDGSSVNVHINLQATTQPGNDVSQRINRARHFLRAASSALNRTEGELPMDTSEPADGQNGSQAGSNSSEGNTAAHSSPEALAQILRETGESMASMQTAINRYVALLQANTPESLRPSEESLPDRVAEALHSLSHAYHALSDITFNFHGSEPRRPSVLASLSPHVAQVPMLSSIVGASSLAPNSVAPATATQNTQSTSATTQQPQGSNQNFRIQVNPQGGISLTTIMSNALQPGSAATASTQLTSTSGTRMSTGTDSGGAGRENSSNASGEQRPSVPVGSSGNGNASSTSTSSSTSSSSTQTGQAGVRTRIIVDDFIALISNVPASAAAVAGATAATASAAQAHLPGLAQAAASSVPHMMGIGLSATGTSPNQNPAPPTSVSSASGVPNATPGQGQAMPPGIAGGIAMNLVSGLGAAPPNHPDASLPCQSFHFGPPSRRPSSGSAPPQTSQPSSTTATATTSAQSRPPRATTTSATATTTTPSATRPSPPVSRSQPPREQPRPQPERRSRGRVQFNEYVCISEL